MNVVSKCKDLYLSTTYQRLAARQPTAAGSANGCGPPAGAGLANGNGVVWLCGQWCQRAAAWQRSNSQPTGTRLGWDGTCVVELQAFGDW